MSIAIADHIRDIPRSGIRDFFEIVQSMDDVISLGIGEPDFATPWHIREAAIYALERGRTGYTSNLGLPRLRRSISDYINKHFSIRYEPLSEILVSVGVSEAIDLALRALLNAGDEVIYHEPCYVSYAPTITMAHGVPVPVMAEQTHRAMREGDVRGVKCPRKRGPLLARLRVVGAERDRAGSRRLFIDQYCAQTPTSRRLTRCRRPC